MKKLFSLVLSTVLLLSMSLTAFAAPSSDSAYREILETVNAEYGLNLEFGSVNTATVSLTEYESTVRTVALEQKLLNELIAQRKEHPLSNDAPFAEARASKTVTKDVWNYTTTFTMTATYDVNSNSISNPRSFSVNRKVGAVLNGIYYTPNNGSPSTSIIDSGRTLAVTYYGTWYTKEITLANTKFYSEFYYDS